MEVDAALGGMGGDAFFNFSFFYYGWLRKGVADSGYLPDVKGFIIHADAYGW